MLICNRDFAKLKACGDGGGGNSNATAENTSYLVRFFVEGVLHETQWVRHGESAVAPAEPTKEPVGQYEYTFSHWDSDYSNITAPTDFNAVFTESLRTLTVRFYNGDTLLQTVNNVPYGGSATYTGDEPVKEGDNAFTGWNPAPTNITGNTDCYAVFRFLGIYSRKLVDRTITTYTSDNLESVGQHAFRDCTSLTSVDIPAVTTIGQYAFYGCTGLSSITFKSTPISIHAGAFGGCNNLLTINVPWAEGAVSGAPWGATNATINYNYTGV